MKHMCAFKKVSNHPPLVYTLYVHADADGDRGIAPTRDCAHERNLSLYGVLVQYAVSRLRGDAPVPSSMLFPDSGFEIAEEPLGRNSAWAQFQWNLS